VGEEGMKAGIQACSALHHHCFNIAAVHFTAQGRQDKEGFSIIYHYLLLNAHVDDDDCDDVDNDDRFLWRMSTAVEGSSIRQAPTHHYTNLTA